VDYHAGECVAILGGGTIGLFTAQWAKIFGAKKVVVFDISPERLELAKKLGADAGVIRRRLYESGNGINRWKRIRIHL
jgi:L-iditol 2-dehydrogenase